LEIVGAPLDNDAVERVLKLFMRQRKKSLFYATEHSVYIVSLLTRLIATCLQAGVNALEGATDSLEERPQRLGLDRIEDCAHRRIARHPLQTVDPLQIAFGALLVKGQERGRFEREQAILHAALNETFPRVCRATGNKETFDSSPMT
jgi:hypothetical protein